MSNVVKDLFNPQVKTSSARTPYESSALESLARSVQEENQRVGTTAGTRTGTTSQTSAGTGSTGLADETLLNPLKAQLGAYDFGTDAPIINDLLQRRLNDGSAKGYARARSRAVQDYGNTIRQVGHLQGLSGRGGDFSERAQRIAQDALSRSLAQGYDDSIAENEGAILNLLAQRHQNRVQPLQDYSNLLASTPFRQTSTQDQTVAGSENIATTQLIDELAKRLYDEETEGAKDVEGFGTQVNFSQSPSIFSQVASLVTGLASAGKPGGAGFNNAVGGQGAAYGAPTGAVIPFQRY